MTNDGGGYHAACDNDNREILEQLAKESNDVDISNSIACYSIGLQDSEIRKKLEKLTLPPLKKTATYLGLIVDGEQRKLKDDIITEIIKRIETLLKDLCAVCGEYYNNKLNSTPSFKCLICQQGCHQSCFGEMNTALAEVNKEMKNSFHFICTRCYSTFSHDNETAAKEIASPVKQVPQPAGDQHAPQPPPHPPADQPNPPAAQQAQPQPPAAQQMPDNTQSEVCKRYRRRECPHGASGKNLINGKPCAYQHPRRCRRYCHNGTHPKYGCTKQNCENLHPMLCKYSVRNRVCTNLDCRFVHLKFTRRFDAVASPDATQDAVYPPSQYHPVPNEFPALPARPTPNYQQPRDTMNPPHQYHHNPMQAPAPQQTVKPPQAGMSFLVEMIQHVKEEFRKGLQDLNTKLESQRQQPPPMQMQQPNILTYQPHPNQVMQRQPQLIHPHC